MPTNQPFEEYVNRFGKDIAKDTAPKFAPFNSTLAAKPATAKGQLEAMSPGASKRGKNKKKHGGGKLRQ